MKRIILFFLIIFVFINMFCFGFASAQKKAYVSDEKAMALITKLGIMDEETDEPYLETTRENFAVFVAKLIKCDNINNDSRYFIDIENNAFSVDAINNLVDKGFISVPENRLFNPQKTITYDEAIKLLVCALDAKDMAESSGGYPIGYSKIAKSLGLKFDFGGDTVITNAIAADMLYRAATIDKLDVSSISKTENGQILHYSDMEKTILSSYWNIKYKSGVVNAVYGAGINGYSVNEKSKIYIEDSLYKIDYIDVDVLSVIGTNVDCYYYDNDDKEIVFITKSNGRGKPQIKIDIADFVSYENKEIAYYEGDDFQTKKINESLIIYNGEELTSNIKETMANLNKGSISLVDSNLDGTYDTMIVYDFANYCVGSIVSNVIYDKIQGTRNIDANHAECVTVRNENNQDVDFNTIAQGDLLSVAKSRSGDNVLIYIASVTFNGEITSESDNYRYSCEINGKSYHVDPSYEEYFKSNVQLGSVYYFTLDVFGNIVYITPEKSTNYKTGYIIKCDTDGGLDKELKFKIIDTDNIIGIYNAREKIRIDGRVYKKQKFEKAAADVNALGSDLVVRFKLDEDNYIKEIDTPNVNFGHESELNSLTSAYEDTSKPVVVSGDMLNFAVPYLSTTKVIYVPYDKSGKTDDDYLVGTPTVAMRPQGNNYVNAYHYSSLNGYADVLLVRYKETDIRNNLLYYRNVYVFKEARVCLNSDGDIVTKVKVLSRSGEIELEMREDVSLDGIESGDIIDFTYDISGKIVHSTTGQDILKVYDCSEKITDQVDETAKIWLQNEDYGYRVYRNTTSSGKYHSAFQFSYGKAIKKCPDGVVKISANEDNTITECIKKGATVIVVERKNEKEIEVRNGTYDDIIAYEDSQVKCSTIIHATRESATTVVIVYNI